MDEKLFVETLALLVSFIAFVFSVLGMKRSAQYTKIDVSNSYRNSLLNWYSRCITTMERLHICKNDENQRLELLSLLSALISEGRFFFPNIESKFGSEKPAAFRGLRCNILDWLVLYFQIFYKNQTSIQAEDIDYIIRNFTSDFFEFMNPRHFISELSETLKNSYKTSLSYDNSGTNILSLAKKYGAQI